MSCDNNTKTSSEIEHVDWSTGTGSGHHYANVRFGSGSSQASQSSGDICRICHCESDPQNPLLTPCYCSGSLKYVHQTCLQQWLTASETNACELCKFPFIMHTKIKPFNEWRSLDISGIERRRLCCSVLFHCAAALCVIWSLCVLIERAADDVQRGLIDWPFWTKLAVVTVGLTGGVVFMYIQCKAYLHLCHRWKARNRILLIQNAPEKIHALSPPSPSAQQRGARQLEAHSTAATTTAISVAALGSGGCSGGGVVLNGSNLATASNAYNYVTSVGAIGSNGSGVNGCGGGGGDGSGSLDMDDALHQHHHHHQLAHMRSSSPHHMLQQAELDLDPMAAERAASMGLLHGGQQPLHHLSATHQHHHPQAGQVAVAANIECSQSQQNYERDWALDDVVSQISSFRPCPQGSGSMTPFHNVLEHSEEDSSRGSRQDLSTGGISSDTGREHALQLSSFSGSGEHKAPSISSGVSNAVANGMGSFVYKPHTKRYSNSSIFLENRDILNDSPTMGMGLDSSTDDYGKLSGYHQHCNITPPPDAVGGVGGATATVDAAGEDNDNSEANDRLEKYLGRDLRRYSDTKLLDSADAEAQNPMLTHSIDNSNKRGILQPTRRHLVKQHSDSVTATDTILDMELPISPLSPPPAYASNSKRLRYHHEHQKQQQQQKQLQQQQQPYALCHSMDTMEAGGCENVTSTTNVAAAGSAANRRTAAVTQQRLFFKSLPNLSSSCESLIKK